jgi:hypothetical protein
VFRVVRGLWLVRAGGLLVGVAEEHYKKGAFLPSLLFLTQPLCSWNQSLFVTLSSSCSCPLPVLVSSSSRPCLALVLVSSSPRPLSCLDPIPASTLLPPRPSASLDPRPASHRHIRLRQYLLSFLSCLSSPRVKSRSRERASGKRGGRRVVAQS